MSSHRPLATPPNSSAHPARPRTSPRCLPQAIALALATIALGCAPAAWADAALPSAVTVVGDLEQAMGCANNWDAACSATQLTLDANDGVWKGSLNLPVGTYQIKVALNGNSAELYGANATANGDPIALTQSVPGVVKFYYDPLTHWLASSNTTMVAVAAGDFQTFMGCSTNWTPSCFRSWLEDPSAKGTFSFTTKALPAGHYNVKTVLNEDWNINFGADGAFNGTNIPFTVPADYAPIKFSFDPNNFVLSIDNGAPKGDISLSKAYWLTADTIAWDLGADAPSATVVLHAAADGVLTQSGNTVTQGERITLSYDPAGVPDRVKASIPNLANLPVFRLAPADAARARALLQGRVAVTATAADGTPLDATSLQIASVIDDLYTYNGALGVVWENRSPSLKLWAPTAQSVKVHLYDSATATSESAVQTLKEDPKTGVWSVAGSPDWNHKYYLYEVTVYAPSAGKVVSNFVTDPYSLSLSADSARSQIVNLDEHELKPEGWDGLRKPPLAAFNDIALYELHVRDFSIGDLSVPAPYRGTYMAFTQHQSTGMRHLREMANAGLTHVHLLPVFDIATVPELKSAQQKPAGDLASFAPDSDQQQAAIALVKDTDGFNWGYDPQHYTTPEGSYATNPNSASRIREFREMVKGLSSNGLRTVMDVVYNHTYASGQADHSVLDKIVPTYYYRLNKSGTVQSDSCCQDTASEHAMFSKLVADSVLTWAKAYKVDGFRFDIMGGLMKHTLLDIRTRLDALTLEKDGVDGKKIYLYGEAWDFSDLYNNGRGIPASWRNMRGTGVGAFSNALYDAGRGGNFFYSRYSLQNQGYVTGLYVDPNGGPGNNSIDALLSTKDQLLVSLAANLGDIQIVDHTGATVQGRAVTCPAGYPCDAALPQESVNYVSVHDGFTLFDAIQAKAAPTDTVADRVRMNNLGVSLVGLAQGIPFFHAGDELLRSKSLDTNSYNSGDWFNALDFSMLRNNWGVGLPPQRDNGSNWGIIGPLLANPALAVKPADIQAANAHFLETLAVRRSTPLLRLRTHDDIVNHVSFHNTGPGQIPGLIAMEVADPSGALDQANARALVLLNADPHAVRFGEATLAGAAWQLHPLQRKSADAVLQQAGFDANADQFTLPGRTAAVFLVKRPASMQFALLTAWVKQCVTDKTLDRELGSLLADALALAEKHTHAGNTRAALALLEGPERAATAAGRLGLIDASVATALAQRLDDLEAAVKSAATTTGARAQ